MVCCSVYIERASCAVPPGCVGGAALVVLRRGEACSSRLRPRRRLAAAGAPARGAHPAPGAETSQRRPMYVALLHLIIRQDANEPSPHSILLNGAWRVIYKVRSMCDHGTLFSIIRALY